MNSYEIKQEARRDRYNSLSQKISKKAHSLHDEGAKALEQIPFGQPILVGHHSEKRDRAYRARAVGKMDKSFVLMDKAEHYANKAESVGTAGISSDDPDAIKKLKEKLETLQKKWEEIKQARRQGKETWSWGVSSDMIRLVKKRIEKLEKLRSMEARPDQIGEGYILRENKEANRLQFIFPAKPSEEIRHVLKSYGFHWSFTEGAWQTWLTERSRYKAKLVIEFMSKKE